MTVHHHEIKDAGQVVAELISLNECWVLFTTHPELRDLDGVVYRTVEEARGAVVIALTEQASRSIASGRLIGGQGPAFGG